MQQADQADTHERAIIDASLAHDDERLHELLAQSTSPLRERYREAGRLLMHACTDTDPGIQARIAVEQEEYQKDIRKQLSLSYNVKLIWRSLLEAFRAPKDDETNKRGKQ